MTIYSHSLKKEDWFSIAKCIDNDFAQSRATFTADKFFTYYMLTTNTCDSCSVVKVYFTADGFIAKIMLTNQTYPNSVEQKVIAFGNSLGILLKVTFFAKETQEAV